LNIKLSHYQLALTSLLCLFFAIFVILNKDLIIDDAYITFQYSRNFAEHLKPWYNLDAFYQGNGQTSLLWMWILSVLNFFGLKSEHSFYIANLIIGFFLIHQSVSLSLKEKKIAVKLFRIGFTLFFTYWLALNSTHGLETVLATIVLFLFLKNWKKHNNPYSVFLILVRPEFGIFLLFWFLDSDFRQTRQIIAKLIYSSAGVVIFALFYLIFYDFYIPLPFILKSSFSTYTLPYIIVFLGRVLVFSPVIFSLILKRRFLFLAPLLFFLFFYSFNINSYSSGIYIRYFFPLMVYFLFADFNINFDNRYTKTFHIIFFILFTGSLLRMIDLGSNFYQNKKDVIIDNKGFITGYGELAKKLKKTDKVLIMDAGHVAYFSSATVYDGYGLNDATMLLTRKNKDSSGYKNYVDERKINIISVVSKDSARFDPRIDSDFTYKSLNLHNKKLLYRFPLDHSFYLFVYQYH